MKTFKTQALIRLSVDAAVQNLRDRLPQLAARTGDPTTVETVQRSEQPDGSLVLENVWRVEVAIPTVLRSLLTADMLAWTDLATWHPDGSRCDWRVTPHFHPDHVHCTGCTAFSPAMAGRGTRVSFEGSFEVTDTNIPGVPPLLRGPAAAALEALAATAIPRGFRKLVTAVVPESDATPAD